MYSLAHKESGAATRTSNVKTARKNAPWSTRGLRVFLIHQLAASARERQEMMSQRNIDLSSLITC